MGAFAPLLLAGTIFAPIAESEKAIVQRVGETFLRNHLVFRPDLSWLDREEPEGPRRTLVWVFRMGEKQMTEPAVSTVVDAEASNWT